MASADITLNLRVRDLDRTRLFMHEVETVVSEMRIAGGYAEPLAGWRERLDRALTRYETGGDDEHGGTDDEHYEVVSFEEVDEPCPRCGYEGGQL